MPNIQINDISTYYEAHGAGDPLLLIHGLGSSLRDWELQVPVFTEHFQVITYNVRGHGRSDKPKGPYSVPMFADDTVALLRALNFSAVNVVGISMGGMIAYQLAVSYPEMVKRLVVANCTPELLVRGINEQLIIWQRELIVRFIGMRKMGEVLSERLFIKPEQAGLRATFVERWAENDKRAYLASMRALVGWSVADQLHNLTMPTLVIAADEDYAFMGDKESYLHLMPDAQMTVVEDSRHATPVEYPELFNQLVMDFLSK